MITPIQRRILLFFQEHSQAVETVRGIATWLGVEPPVIEEALEQLVRRGWLVIHKASAVTGYALTHDERISTEIKSALGGGAG